MLGGTHRLAADHEVPMPMIYLTSEAHAAIERSPHRTPGYGLKAPNPDGTTWVDDEVLQRLEALRGPDESLSDVVIQICAAGGATRQ